MSSNFSDLYTEEYFADGQYGGDPERSTSYRQEYGRLSEFMAAEGRVLDVGCGTGDFLSLFDSGSWERYGVEVSDYAAARAEEKGVRITGYDLPKEHLDLVVLRGTLQHLDEPFAALRACYDMLKPGGWMTFLATPNSGSIYYRLFSELPALDPPRNFLIPSDIMLTNTLENMGMEEIKFHYPYLGSPYSKVLRDHTYFLLRFFGVRRRFAFWKNMMECYARKPNLNELAK